MHKLHPDAGAAERTLTPEALARRLARETQARQAAEALLEGKSRELYEANRALKETATSLDNQRRYLNTILDHTQVGIVLAQDDLSIRRANRSAEAMFASAGGTLSGQTVCALFEDTPEASVLIARLSAAGGTEGDTMVEAVGRRSDGTTFPIEVGLASMAHQGGRHTVWMFRDITKRKAVEARRAALERELSQAQKMEALGTLASGVAHEINTPVQYVGDNIRFMQDAFGDLSRVVAAYREALALAPQSALGEAVARIRALEDEIDLQFLLGEVPTSIEQSLQGMGQVASIVNAIKEFSHPGEDEKVAVDINKAIETTLTVSRNQWKYVAEVELALAEGLPAVPCLPGDINQVLLNLIVNAADAIAARGEGEPGRIAVATALAGGEVEIRIADNGCGIPPEVAGRVFDPFFTTKDVGKGTGQGLAISYAIVRQKHGGSIGFAARPGGGTCFTIRLPLHAASLTEEEVAA